MRWSCSISDSKMSVIMQARKILLFNDSKPWIEKSDDEHFGPIRWSRSMQVSCQIFIRSTKRYHS